MEKSTIRIGNRSASIYRTASSIDCPIIYTQLSSEVAETIAELLTDTGVVLVALEDVDWERDLSPWPTAKAFRSGNDFTGGADAYLKDLTEMIVPAVEELLDIVPAYRGIVGYSLAGLFSIYALYRTTLFSRAASVSGSLWYDGFLDYLKANSPILLPDRVYFSLGDREREVRNPRLAAVEACTSEAEKYFQALGAKTIFELNPGNHFTYVPERIAKAIIWLCKDESLK